MIIPYTDYCIILSKSKADGNAIFKEPTKKDFKVTDDRTVEENIVILITHYDDGSFRISRPHLIERIISSISNMKHTRISINQLSVGVILTKNVEGEAHKEHWNYMSILYVELPSKMYTPINITCGPPVYTAL